MPWATLIIVILAGWIFLDHLGSRRVRHRAQRRAASVFAPANKRKYRIPKHISPALRGIQNDKAAAQQTVRLKVKGARRIRSKQTWLPLEAKLFFAPETPALVLYADLTRWAFFSQKELVCYHKERLQAQRFLFSLLPQKISHTSQDVRQYLLVGLPWWPSLAGHPDLIWEKREENRLVVSWKQDGEAHGVDWQLDGQNRWQCARFSCPGRGDSSLKLAAHCTEYRTFDGWNIPVRVSVEQTGETVATLAEYHLTEWIANEDYRWW